MAIDTAAKRRNVSRMMLSCIMGLSPSNGLDTDDRVNAARAYIGFDYTAAPAAEVDRLYIRYRMTPTHGILLRVK